MSVFMALAAKGGPITICVLVLGFVALVLIIERIFHYHRAHIDVPEFMRGVCNVLKRGNVAEAVSICDDTPGPVAHVLRAVMLGCDGDREKMERAALEAGYAELPRLEHHVKALGTVALLAPLLGLLGTVVGMITLFRHIQEGGVYVETKTLAEGIWQALLSTAAGLTVAIVAHGFHNHFVSRTEQFVIEMEKAAAEMVHFLLEQEIRTTRTSRNGAAEEQADG